MEQSGGKRRGLFCAKVRLSWGAGLVWGGGGCVDRLEFGVQKQLGLGRKRLVGAVWGEKKKRETGGGRWGAGRGWARCPGGSVLHSRVPGGGVRVPTLPASTPPPAAPPAAAGPRGTFSPGAGPGRAAVRTAPPPIAGRAEPGWAGPGRAGLPVVAAAGMATARLAALSPRGLPLLRRGTPVGR